MINLNKNPVDKCLILGKYSTKPKYYDDSNTLVNGKMKDEMSGVAIEEFLGSKTKVNLILVSDSNEYKKSKDVNKNVAS